MGEYLLHPQALCESTKIGARTRIWAFAHVLSGARLGADCNVCDHVFVENDVTVGDRVTIKCGVQLWDGVDLEDDVFVGPNVTFTNDLFPRSKQHPERFLRTRVRKGASLGANATILPGLTIGRGAMVGAGAVVTKDVPEFGICVGNPARVVGDTRFRQGLQATLDDPRLATSVPLVSVLVPSYNYAAYLEECVRSVWAQQWPRVECIIVDDASSDDSPRIAQRLAAEAPIPTRFLQLPHGGIVRALNKALEESTGEFIAVLAADDRFHPEKTHRQVAALIATPSAGLAHCDFSVIDAAGTPLSLAQAPMRPPAEGPSLLPLLAGKVAMRTGYLVRRDFLSSIGGFDVRYPHEDWPLYLKAARWGPIAWVGEPLVDRRIHGQNWSSTRFGDPRDVFTHAAVEILEQIAPTAEALDQALSFHLTRPLRVALHEGQVQWAAGVLRVLIGRYPRLAPRFLREAGLGGLSLLYRQTGKRLLPMKTSNTLSAFARNLLEP